MRNIRLEQSLRCEQREVADMIADIAASEIDSCVRSVEALAQVCRGVITGEGPTTSGRVHFSRTIDVEDTVLCARILVAAGRHGNLSAAQRSTPCSTSTPSPTNGATADGSMI